MAPGWICLGLGALVCLAYAPVVRHDFVDLDDRAYITANPHVREGLGWDGIGWAFTSCREGNWHPVTWLSHMLDCTLFGHRPAGHHAMSVLLHAANAVLLFLALVSMTGAPWPSAFVAALFGVHPLRVESVAWAAERKDMLSGLFFMLTLLTYAGYRRRPGTGRYLLVLACLGLGLMAKPMLVTLPWVLLLLDIWPLGRLAPTGRWRRLVLEKAPLLALCAASSLVTLLCQAKGGATASFEDVPLGSRVANALVAYAVYLWKTIWPTRLAVYYPHPALISPRGLSSSIVPAAGAAVLALLTVLVIRLRRRRPYLLVGWLWYLGMLVPVIGLVQVGMQARADRYAYLSLVGIYIALAWGGRDLAARSTRVAALLKAAAPLALAASVGVTWMQLRHWQDTTSLYEHALEVTTGNFVVHNNLGVAYQDRGDLEAARAQYESALGIRPEYAFAHNNLGIVHRKQGAHREALAEFEAALRLRPDLPEALDNLGNLFEEQGDLPRAAAYYQAALRAHPEDADVRSELAAVLAKQGRLAEAAAHYEAVLRIRPDDADALNGLGIIHASHGDVARAAASFEAALRSEPGLADAHNNLGIILMRAGELAGARAHFERALEIKPDYFEAHYNLALVHRKRGDLGSAAAEYAAALQLKPGDARARDELAAVRLELGGRP